MEDNKICETIRELRKRRGISQDILAQAFDVSVQAISKWETGNSLPDILLLPAISRFFGIKIDELFYGLPEPSSDEVPVIEGIKDDGVLRVVQFLGTKYLGHEEWIKDKHIFLDVKEVKQDFNVEVWGSADINGDVKGGLNAGDGVNCGNVGGGISAGDGVNCGNVNGGINSGDGVNCGNVGGGIECGDGVNCGNVGGGITAGDGVNCGNVGGSVEADGGVNCGDIYGNLEADGEVRCNEIKNAQSIECEKLIVKGNVKAGTINGEVHHEGNITIDF